MSWNNKINTIRQEKSYFVKIYKNKETAITHLKQNQNHYTHLHLKSCSINKTKDFWSFKIFYSCMVCDSILLGCYCATGSPVIQGPLYPWRWGHYVPLKYCEPVTQWCSVISERNRIPHIILMLHRHTMWISHTPHTNLILKLKKNISVAVFEKLTAAQIIKTLWNVSFFIMRTFARHFNIFSSINGFKPTYSKTGFHSHYNIITGL